MRPLIQTVVLFAILAVGMSRYNFEHYKNEGHNIMKRMAEAEEYFEEHDMATVHLVEGQGRRSKRMTRENLRDLSDTRITNRLQLGLSSGSKLNLALRSADIGHSDTVVSYHTENGYEQGKRIATDCYFYGQMKDSTGIGWAAISHCDGVFGFASSPSYEYFLHPVGSRRFKREADERFDVHVLWRRSPSGDVYNDTIFDGYMDDEVEVENESNEEGGSAENYQNATGFVVEMAMFSDEQYWKRISNLYPGREDDFLLTRLAGTQAIYGDRKDVGYDVKIKLKYLEYWKTDPVNYTFAEDFSNNMRSFCQLTVRNHRYDIHALNTGIVQWHNGRQGLAYVGNICKRKRCFVLKGVDFKSFVGFGHELGHTLGLSHRSTAKCPPEINPKRGFMGGGSSLYFAPCMSYKLSRFFKMGNGRCLFTEKSESKTPTEYQSVPSLYPGQSRTPDGLCRILAGAGYKYLTNERSVGQGLCLWFICLDEDKDSPEFLRAQRFFAPMGFPCKAEAMCTSEQVCRLWNETKMTVEAETLRNLTKVPQWTEWSEMSPCSRSCGTGVRVRRRECHYADYNLAPHCPGMPVKPELCNTQPCEAEPTTIAELRHLRGDEVCTRFVINDVRLRMKKATAYLPEASKVKPDDTGPNIPVGHSISCLIKCVRIPKTVRGELDAVLPDGTLCLDFRRPRSDLDRLSIQMRCLRGHCHEFSDCPDGRQIKDDCGICDGDGSRCFNLTINANSIPRGDRAKLTVIPSSSTNIDVYFDRSKGTGIILELWSHDDRNIIGHGGQYPKADYEGPRAIEFAGTKWMYKPHEAYMRSAGPTSENVTIKAFRNGRGVKLIAIHYARAG